MSSGFQTPITIKDAINNIHNRKYLLPAIQRKFTWTSAQVEMLFDSILRGYPINSFMLWRISDDAIKCGYKFYQFLQSYREFFAENNQDIDTTAVPDFEAVIDGQQRLTSLYIGLHGSYAYRTPRKWLRDDESSLPTRRLYLNLESPVNQQYDNQKQFDFRFLSKVDIVRFSKSDVKCTWFEVKEILQLDELQKVNRYINDKMLTENDYAYNTLVALYERIHKERLINYYLQEEQEPDKVLEIFIRTNSGGTPLAFSDLLMSIAAANWKIIDARKEIEDLVEQVYTIGRPGFIINKDFILKTCLVLFIDNIKFQIKNFSHENVQVFENNWSAVRDSIIAGFTLIEKLGFNDKTFRAKNAAIPIIYYIFHNKLSKGIVKPTYSADDRKTISRWLALTFIKTIFGGQTDTVLITMRGVLRENIGASFPAGKLMEAFRADPARNYSLNDDYIDGLLEAQKDSSEAFYVLQLLYPHLDYYNQNFHHDHLHPASLFRATAHLHELVPADDFEFASDPKNWNSVLNLQLLNEFLNTSKQDKSLGKWVMEERISHQDLYLSDNISLDIADFKTFITDRRRHLQDALKKRIY
jgi:uncharacterized protein with ParB-like and HNH nuclease domain